MKKSTQWFAKNAQQTVMSKISSIHTFARTGPSNRKSSTDVKTKILGENLFIVGESEVGGEDRVGGTL
jgi:hypothetical protein